MSRRTVMIIAVMALLAICAVPATLADQNIPVNWQYQMDGKNIIVHVDRLAIMDAPFNNVYYPPEDARDHVWVNILYRFENIGDTLDKGFIQPVLIDESGNRYQNVADYTSQSVRPHTTTDLLDDEIMVPKNATIVRIECIEGFETHETNISPASPTPTASPPSPAPSATPAPGDKGWLGCIPVLPFAMVGGIGAAGIVINRSVVRKR